MASIYRPTPQPIAADEVERIARQVAREEVAHHEARFTVAGAAVGVVAVLVGLVATGRF